MSIAADAVGVACHHEGRAAQLRIRQRIAQRLNGGHRFLADVGRVEVEMDFQIDLRLGRGDLGDLLALAERQRPRLAVADAGHEAHFLGLDGRIDLRGADDESAG